MTSHKFAVTLAAGAIAACGLAVGWGNAADTDVKPKAAAKDVKKPVNVAAPQASAKEARARLADSLNLTELQRDAMARAHEELDIQRAALLADMDPLLADIKKTLLDENSTAEQKQKARRRLDDLHQEFRRIEAERKARLEALLSPEQKKKLDELSTPAADTIAATVVPQQVIRTLKRHLTSIDQESAFRKSKEALDRKVSEAERMRHAAVEDFYHSVLPLLNEAQRAEVEQLRKRLEKARPKAAVTKTAERPAEKGTTNAVVPAKP